MEYDARKDGADSYDGAIDAMRERHEALLAAGAKRIEYVGDAILVQGNCLDVMPILGRVSHIISDPPYEQTMQDLHAKTKLRRTDGGAQRKSLNFNSIENIRKPFLKLTECEGWLLAFCNVEGAGEWRREIINAGFKFKTTCVWVKPDATPKMNGQGPALSYECITTSWAGKGHSKWNAGGKRGVYTHNTKNPERSGKHPTEKPASLMRELIHDFTKSNQTILDPFMGSGTTGVAAIQLGRKFIGIELDPDYFDIAVKRCKEAWSQPRLFEEPKQKPPPTMDMFD